VAGAGFAGLTAAFRLLRWGSPTVVLEARDRVGGRVHTVRLANDELAELGAEWIEEDAKALFELAAELALELVPTGVDYRRRRGVGPLGASVEDQERALEIARRALDARRGDVAGESLGAFLRALPVSESQRATLTARLQGTCASDLDGVPLRVAERGTFDGGSGRYGVAREPGGRHRAGGPRPDIRSSTVERIRVSECTWRARGRTVRFAGRRGRGRRAGAAGGRDPFEPAVGGAAGRWPSLMGDAAAGRGDRGRSTLRARGRAVPFGRTPLGGPRRVHFPRRTPQALDTRPLRPEIPRPGWNASQASTRRSAGARRS
jgi:hypothetical protein